MIESSSTPAFSGKTGTIIKVVRDVHATVSLHDFYTDKPIAFFQGEFEIIDKRDRAMEHKNAAILKIVCFFLLMVVCGFVGTDIATMMQ